jgi:hypothetical protein
MARTRTLTDLIADVRFRADNQAATDAEITELINQSIADLYDMLAAAFGDEYFEVDAISTTQANVETLALPSNFYKLTGVWRQISSNQWVRLLKYGVTESEQIVPTTGWDYVGDVYYRLRAADIRFVPTPQASFTINVKYCPAAVRLVNPTDTFDGYNGFEEWPIVDSSMKLLEREGNDSNAALLAGRKDRMEKRIAEMADRDQAEPSRILDVTARSTSWGRW